MTDRQAVTCIKCCTSREPQFQLVPPVVIKSPSTHPSRETNTLTPTDWWLSIWQKTKVCPIIFTVLERGSPLFKCFLWAHLQMDMWNKANRFVKQSIWRVMLWLANNQSCPRSQQRLFQASNHIARKGRFSGKHIISHVSFLLLCL